MNYTIEKTGKRAWVPLKIYLYLEKHQDAVDFVYAVRHGSDVAYNREVLLKIAKELDAILADIDVVND